MEIHVITEDKDVLKAETLYLMKSDTPQKIYSGDTG